MRLAPFETVFRHRRAANEGTGEAGGCDLGFAAAEGRCRVGAQGLQLSEIRIRTPIAGQSSRRDAIAAFENRRWNITRLISTPAI